MPANYHLTPPAARCPLPKNPSTHLAVPDKVAGFAGDAEFDCRANREIVLVLFLIICLLRKKNSSRGSELSDEYILRGFRDTSRCLVAVGQPEPRFAILLRKWKKSRA